MINKILPKNLKILLKYYKLHVDYEIERCYYLELEHDRSSTNEMFVAREKMSDLPIISLDPAVVALVWKRMTPRRSKMSSKNFFVVSRDEQKFIYPKWSDKGGSRPVKCFTYDDLGRLVESSSDPFVWTPGLIDRDLTKEELDMNIYIMAERYDLVPYIWA